MGRLVDGQESAALGDIASTLSGYLDEVSGDLLGTRSDADLLAELREFEVLRRRLAVVDHALIAELGRRALAGRLLMSSTAAFLQAALRLSPYEANQRVSAAQLCGPRWALTGEPLETLLPQVAAGQASGVVSAEQARAIASTLAQLPNSINPAEASAAEQHLVTAAAQLPPRQIGILGQRILAQLDPDGVLGSDEEHTRRRSFALLPQADGSYRAAGRLTPACGALLLTWLSPRSAPRPAATFSAGADNGLEAPSVHPTAALGPDARNHGQRMHDALQELAGLAVRRTELLDSGAPAQVIITMTADQVASRQGWAETSFGQLISVDAALNLADEAAINLLLRDAKGVVLGHGRTKRIATRAQTPRPDRQGSGLLLPRVRQATRMVPATSPRRLG